MISHSRHMLLTLLADAVQEGDFTGASGRALSHYLDCRTVTYTLAGRRAAKLIHCKIAVLDNSRSVRSVGGPGFGAAPLVAGLTGFGYRGFAIREETKRHGAGGQIVGAYASGDAVVLVDDVATSGGSLIKAAAVVHHAGGTVLAAIVLVDRQDGAGEKLASIGIPLFSVFTFAEILKHRREFTVT